MFYRHITPALCIGLLVALPMTCLAASLPQDHDYQKQLRNYLASLKEADFVVASAAFTVPPGERTSEELFRASILAAKLPPINSIKQPASQFTLQSIEGEQAIMEPPASPEALGWLATWDYAGNPYRGSRAVKLRAFVAAAVDMMMLDDYHEKKGMGKRSDFLGGTLIWLAYAYKGSRDVLPPEAKAAYEAGLKKLVSRLNEWGPAGAMTDMDLFAPVSMHMVAELVGDPETARIAETYAKHLFTSPEHFHPAGYFVDVGCFDTSYNGISLYFSTWAALQAPDWPFVREALDKAYRLKGFLTLPEPDGRNFFGPSQCSSRTSACPPHDQWDFPPRNLGAAMLTDNALFLTTLPGPEALKRAEQALVNALNNQLTSARPIDPKPWAETHWTGSINYAYDGYVKGYYEKRAKLEAEHSPLLKAPFTRDGEFIEDFSKVFLIARYPDYGFVIHTGPVSSGLHGFGGGELCGFWTPKTGSVILGRRRGAQSPTPDTFDGWRIWPVHAVTGVTAEGKVFSSSRIVNPHPVYTIKDKRAEVRVEGLIPKVPTNNGVCLQGDVQYARTFAADASGLNIATSVKSDGKDNVAELYETIPVFLRDGRYQASEKPAKVSFKVGDAWRDGTADAQDGVGAVKIERFTGAVLVTFTKPQRVRLSPEDWSDLYQSRANCRTIMIDLLGNKGQPKTIPEVTVEYKITPVKE